MYNNETSKKIIKTALKLFSEKGYGSTTTKQIAEDAGVSELTIFRHFGSKSSLFQVATEDVVMDSRVEEILYDTELLSFSDGMQLITRRIYRLFMENTELYKLQMKLSDDEHDFTKLKLSRSLIAVLAGYFAKLISTRQIQGEPEIMAVTLISSLLGTLTIEILGDYTVSSIPWEELVREHTRQFIALYDLP